jgi:RNA polymerase-binding transcription factor DksA
MHHKTDAATNARSTVINQRPQAIRNQLDEQRRFRIEQLQELTADATEAIATADDQVTRVLTLAAESALAEIEGALQRLEQGTYGTCERCTKPIPSERLEVLPMTGLCTPCQWMAESDHSRPRRSRTSASSPSS